MPIDRKKNVWGVGRKRSVRRLGLKMKRDRIVRRRLLKDEGAIVDGRPDLDGRADTMIGRRRTDETAKEEG